MKLVLCYPSTLPGKKPKYGLQPLGILYIAAVLKQSGIDVELIDADIEGLTIKEMVDRILAAKPDMAGFSVMTPQLASTFMTTTFLKEIQPSLPIVLGGAHISSTLDDVFSLSNSFDFAVYGEGEQTMLDVVKSMEKASPPDCLDGIAGVIFRNRDGNVKINPPRHWIADLDSLPSLNYDMLDITKYRIPTMTGRYVITRMISRGCPFKCTFCDAPTTTGRKIRFHSPEKAVDEIHHTYKKYGARSFSFRDSTFSANADWVFKFCEAVIRSGMKISWRCGTRVNCVSDELLKIMKRAGCYTINFGVESGHPDILKRLKKGITIEEIYRAHELTRKNDIRTYSTFMIGSPGETEETVKATIKVAKEIRPNLAMFFVAVAYPGTEMYEQALADGTVEARWWGNQDWDSERHSAFEKRWGWTADGALTIPGFDAEYWQKRATRSFYINPRFMWDTTIFTLKNPYFMRHLVNLGLELVPFYRIPLPWKKPSEEKDMNQYSKCPSEATFHYERRNDVSQTEK